MGASSRASHRSARLRRLAVVVTITVGTTVSACRDAPEEKFVDLPAEGDCACSWSDGSF